MRSKLMIETWPVPAARRAKKRQTVKLTWWSVIAMWRSKPSMIVVLGLVALIYAALFFVPPIGMASELALVPRVLICALAGLVLIAALYCLTTFWHIVSPTTIVLVDDQAMAVAKGKLAGGTEVWTLINHSVRHQHRGHGAVFRGPLWAALIQAHQSGIEVQLRASHVKVHRIYLTELRMLGYQLRPIPPGDASSKRSRYHRHIKA
ncbi:hypothetical protein [Agreia sp. VKM Ac-1783]|uniref:hypothetical protein n=1 Tax=Agreia sp. VKM Ac-1783 TaxID=1938889 RepID=UPI000A2ADD8B|nr:hypothetical protein [Agreia sp. VKM Ac-1783]SMQ71908.1 hypothetical protein SAMN06295943_2793 [Agreia sp. VKM Ac-1783]